MRTGFFRIVFRFPIEAQPYFFFSLASIFSM